MYDINRLLTTKFPTGGSAVKPIIYFAGKISRYDWRKAVLNEDRPGAADDDCIWKPDYVLDRGRFYYGGPFFISCDHGCRHVPNAHGSYEECGGSVDPHALAQTQRKVWNINCQRLRRADQVFAFIDEMDCYGTMVELGMAAQMKKPIILGLGLQLTASQLADLWMPRAAARTVVYGTAAQTWKKACDIWGLA
jgi:hypothetical protein